MTTQSLKRINGLSAGDLLERKFRPRQQIIDPWLRTSETGIIWAPSGVGKTMLCLSLAMAVAGGGSVDRWQAPTARKVLYVDGEMHLEDIKDRIAMLAETKAVKPRCP